MSLKVKLGQVYYVQPIGEKLKCIRVTDRDTEWESREYDDAIEEEDDELNLDGQAKPSLIDIEEILALEANKFDRKPLIYLLT